MYYHYSTTTTTLRLPQHSSTLALSWKRNECVGDKSKKHFIVTDIGLCRDLTVTKETNISVQLQTRKYSTANHQAYAKAFLDHIWCDCDLRPRPPTMFNPAMLSNCPTSFCIAILINVNLKWIVDLYNNVSSSRRKVISECVPTDRLIQVREAVTGNVRSFKADRWAGEQWLLSCPWNEDGGAFRHRSFDDCCQQWTTAQYH